MKEVNASTVRAWLTEQGQNPGKRGRISAEQKDAFNKAHSKKGLKYVPQGEAEKPTIEVPGVVTIDKAGRKATRTVTVTTEAARALLGHEAGRRGRFSKATLALALSAQAADEVADQFV